MIFLCGVSPKQSLKIPPLRYLSIRWIYILMNVMGKSGKSGDEDYVH
jgi:hypothetical protein